MNPERFTKEAFAKECVKRGYVSFRDGGKQGALKWCKEHPKDFYTESDMLAVYRYFDAKKFGDGPETQPYDYAWTHDPM